MLDDVVSSCVPKLAQKKEAEPTPRPYEKCVHAGTFFSIIMWQTAPAMSWDRLRRQDPVRVSFGMQEAVPAWQDQMTRRRQGRPR